MIVRNFMIIECVTNVKIKFVRMSMKYSYIGICVLEPVVKMVSLSP